MRLIVLSRYRNRDVTYEAGQTLDLPDAQASALLADSPGSFIAAPDEPAEPPADKMIRRAPVRKVSGSPPADEEPAA